MWENEVAAVKSGLRVLIPTKNRGEAKRWLREMVDSDRDMKPLPHKNMVTCDSGGNAHFAYNDEQVRGMEYHEAGGPRYQAMGLSACMQSRVRLSAGEDR